MRSFRIEDVLNPDNTICLNVSFSPEEKPQDLGVAIDHHFSTNQNPHTLAVLNGLNLPETMCALQAIGERRPNVKKIAIKNTVLGEELMLPMSQACIIGALPFFESLLDKGIKIEAEEAFINFLVLIRDTSDHGSPLGAGAGAGASQPASTLMINSNLMIPFLGSVDQKPAAPRNSGPMASPPLLRDALDRAKAEFFASAPNRTRPAGEDPKRRARGAPSVAAGDSPKEPPKKKQKTEPDQNPPSFRPGAGAGSV